MSYSTMWRFPTPAHRKGAQNAGATRGLLTVSEQPDPEAMKQTGQNRPPQHELLAVTIDGLGALRAAYMPFVLRGGLFIPTNDRYLLGQQVFVLLRLPDAPESLPLAGTVVWIAPPGTRGSAWASGAAGIGVQFGDGNESLKRRIEACLADSHSA